MHSYAHVGIVVATTAEQEPLIHILEQMTRREIALVKHDIWHIAHVQLGALLVSMIHSGIGMVNAGAATEALVIYERPELLLNYGIAGAHVHDGHPGDIVIATHVCAPWSGYLRPGGILDFAFGIRWEEEGKEDDRQPVQRNFSRLACEPALVQLLRQVSEVLVEQHALTSVAPAGQGTRGARIFHGSICSADTYCQDEKTVARMRETFGSLCEDMESAAVGQMATRHGLPFAIVRCLSNNDLFEVLTQEQKRLLYPEMMRRAALVIARLLHGLSTAAGGIEEDAWDRVGSGAPAPKSRHPG